MVDLQRSEDTESPATACGNPLHCIPSGEQGDVRRMVDSGSL